MKTKAAVIVEPGKPFEIEELDLDGPGVNEVLVRYTHAGLCHSDVHILDGSFPARLPLVGGHEGSGIVEEVGPGVDRVKPGDHFVASFIPACGTCKWCATGRQPLCDSGATILDGWLPGERPFPITGPRGDYGAMSMLGTFSQYGVVHQNSIVPIAQEHPLDKAVLVGCGVPTGWGSAVNAAAISPGETVLIYGIGGVGINAVQGADHVGAKNIVAVDPLAFKREKAEEFGATHAVATAEEAQELALELTAGVGADKAIITVGVTSEPVVSAAFDAIRKGGTVVLTSMGKLEERSIHVQGVVLGLYKKTIRGTLYGDCNPTTDIARLLDLYSTGAVKLDELITKTYTLEQVNEGYDDLLNGELIRGVIVHEHGDAAPVGATTAATAGVGS